MKKDITGRFTTLDALLLSFLLLMKNNSLSNQSMLSFQLNITCILQTKFHLLYSFDTDIDAELI